MSKKQRFYNVEQWIKSCAKCPFKTQPQDECYYGKPYYKCPDYMKAIEKRIK